MGIKLHILFLALTFGALPVIASDKFLSIKGVVLDEVSKEPLADYTIKLVQDRLDSVSTGFSKPQFQVWAPANRRTTVYFIKSGYVTKHIYIDASYIPSIAFKVKQQIELEMVMTPIDKAGRRNFTKPVMTAAYEASSNAFAVQVVEQSSTPKVSDDYSPPFPAPVDTYKGVQPTANNLALTAAYNHDKVKSNSDFFKVIQGILFADMNYCFFNERTNDANAILQKLAAMDQENWGNLKPMDSPEYGKIVMRTLNREQSADTLFALGAYVESSRLIFENFTSDTKVLVHLKKFKEVMQDYSPYNLTSAQAVFVEDLKKLIPTIEELEKTYTESLRNKSDFDLNTDDLFLAIKSENQRIYTYLIE